MCSVHGRVCVYAVSDVRVGLLGESIVCANITLIHCSAIHSNHHYDARGKIGMNRLVVWWMSGS